MTAPILKALASGYTSKQIIDFLIKKYPEHANQIHAAVSMGFGPNQIIKYLMGGRKELHNPDSQITEHEETLKSDISKRENVNKAALAAAGTLAIGGLAGGYLANSAQAIPQVLPGQNAIANQSPAPVAQAMNQQAIQRAIPNAGIPQTTQQIATQAATAAPQPVQQPVQQPPVVPQRKPALQIAQELNLVPHIQSLMKNYQDPKHVAAVLNTQFPKEMQQFQKESAKPMEEAIAETMQSIPAPMEEEPIEETKPLQVGSKVITPSDEIGEIERISGKTAQIKTEDGKIGAPLEKAIPLTEEYNDVLDNYKKLIESIPEEYKSGPLNFIGYDPDSKKLSLRFNSGDQYVYEDIPEEEANAIAEALHLAKTTGQNFYGSWAPGDPSRGAGANKLIAELQKKYGGKGKEYSAKFKTLYDFLALPKQLLAEEEKRKKDEERARKKAQKKR